MRKLAIVGSRDYPDLAAVRAYVLALPWDTIVVSGGAYGVDKAAEDAARERRMSRIVLEPACPTNSSNAVYTAALLARNTLIAKTCDEMVAYWFNRSSGTRDAIDKTEKLGKPVTKIEMASKPTCRVCLGDATLICANEKCPFAGRAR